jgi:hypothetical protein
MEIPKVARISVIDDERGLILGQDFSDVLKKGVVYEITELLGTLVIKEIGISSIQNRKEKNSDANTQVLGGYHIMTDEELLDLSNKTEKFYEEDLFNINNLPEEVRESVIQNINRYDENSKETNG